MEFSITLLAVLVLLMVFWYFRKRFGKSSLDQRSLNYIHSHWVRIIDSFAAGPGQAVLDADKLLDYALKARGYEGTTGEKMKKAGSLFSDQNGIWQAHKLRNRLAHEMFDLSKVDAKQALKNFKKALNDLGAGL